MPDQFLTAGDFEPTTVEQFEAVETDRTQQQQVSSEWEEADPLDVFSVAQLADDENFVVEGYVKQHPDALSDDLKTSKLALVRQTRRSKPVTAKDVGAGIWGLGWNGVKQVWNLAKGIGTIGGDLGSQSDIGAMWRASKAISEKVSPGTAPEAPEELRKSVQDTERKLVSDVAGLEKGTFGFADWLTKAPRALRTEFTPGAKVLTAAVPVLGPAILAARAAAPALGVKKLEDMTKEEMNQELRDDMNVFLQGEAIGEGEGEFSQAIAGETLREIKERGEKLDPERVETVAAADPLGFIVFGEGMRLLSPVAKAAKGVAKGAAVKAGVTGETGAVAAGRELSKLREAVEFTRQRVPPGSQALQYAEDLLAQAERDVGVIGKASAAVEKQVAKADELFKARTSAKFAEQVAKRTGAPETAAAAEKIRARAGALEAQAGVVPRAIQAVRQVAAAVSPEKIAQQVAGRAIQATGLGVRALGAVARATPGVAVGATAASAAMSGNLPVAFGALIGGKMFQAGRVGKALQRPLAAAGKSLEEAGRRVATGTPATPVQKAIIGVSQGLGDVVRGAARGVPMDVGFALALAEDPEQVREMSGYATGFGAIHAGGRIPARYAQSMLIGKMAQAQTAPVRRVPGVPITEAAQASARNRRGLVAEEQNRLTNLENVLQQAGSDTPVYYLTQPEFLNTLIQQHRARTGADPTPEQMAEIQNYSEQRGMFQENVIGSNGQPGSAIFVTALEAGAHEGQHAFQHVLGTSGNQFVDQVVFGHYAPQWDAIGTQYTAQLTGRAPSANWRSELATFVPESIRKEAGGNLDAAADIYMAREIAAENFSTLFDATGGRPQVDPGLLHKLAQVVDRTSRFLGVDLLAGAQTPGGIGVAPSGEVMDVLARQTRGAAKGAAAPVEIRPLGENVPRSQVPSAPSPNAPPPVTPEQRQVEAENARAVAQEAPDTTLPGAKMSQREILGAVAEAIANDEGVQYAYRQAPEAAGAAIEQARTARRAEVEAARNMPEDVRQMVEKTGQPYRIGRTSGGVFQIHDWAPDMFASNAVRWAKALTELAAREPANAALSRIPYELDLAKGEWTEQGWRDLFRDAEIGASNQGKGFTMSGESLVVPERIRAAGRYAPPETGVPTPLEQGRADFLNLLHNIRVPETPRITGRKLPGNIVAQEISAATKPGRVGAPAERASGKARQPFEGERAREMGIEGRTIQEVNPLRGELERALQAQKIALPDGIEVVRRLNLEHLANVTAEPNLPRTTGRNVLALEAGFLPRGDIIGQYLPARAGGEARERIEAAAFRLPDGTIITGRSHFLAMLDAVNAGKLSRETLETENWGEDGFVTDTGRFVDRNEALTVSQEAGQITKEQAAQPSFRGGELESTKFEENRAFLPAKNLAEGEIFHATSDAGKGEAILRDGFVKPGSETQQRGTMAPVAEQVSVGQALPRGFTLSVQEQQQGGVKSWELSVKDKDGNDAATIRFSAEGGRGYLQHISTEPDYQRRGLATALQKEMAEILKGNGIRNVEGVVISPEAAELRAKNFPETRFHRQGEATAMPLREAVGTIIEEGEVAAYSQFLPASREGYDQVSKMSAKEFAEAFKAGGLQDTALAIGKAIGEEIIPMAEAARADIPNQMRAAMKAMDFDTASALANKGQFYGEVVKGARGETAPTGQALPPGYKLEETSRGEFGKSWNITMPKTRPKPGFPPARITARTTEDMPGTAEITYVSVPEEFRRQGIGTALLQQMRDVLVKKGFTTITGQAISPQSAAMTEKAFGIRIPGKDAAIPSRPAEFSVKVSRGQALPKKMVEIDELPAETKDDIVAWLHENVKELSSEENSDVRANLLGLVDAPVVEMREIDPNSIRISRARQANISDEAVRKFAQMPPETAPPLVVAGDTLLEGGHRLNAAKIRGDATVPVVDIGPLRDMDWKKWMRGEESSEFPTKAREGQALPRELTLEALNEAEKRVGLSPSTEQDIAKERSRMRMRRSLDSSQEAAIDKLYRLAEAVGKSKAPSPAAQQHVQEMAAAPTPTKSEPKIALPLSDSGVPASQDGATAGGPLMQAMGRGYKEWLEKQWFGNEQAKKVYSPQEMESFAKGLEMTAKIFGDFSTLPPEVAGVSAWRGNQDPKFKKTLDFTTVCPKQDQFVAVTKALEKEQGRIFSALEKAAIGEMMREAGNATCWICYGQSARNMWDQSVQRIADILNEVKTMDAWTSKESTPATQKLFGTWTDTGGLRKFIDANIEELRKFGKVDSVRIRDIVRGDVAAKDAFEQSLADMSKRVADSTSHANEPKGYAPYVDDFLGKSAKRDIDDMNRIAGARLNSQSDFRVWHTLELAQAMSHLKTQDGLAHAYTRIDELLRIFGKTGLKFNMSVEASDPATLPLSARRGSLTYEEFKKLHKEHGDPLWDDMNSFPEARVEHWRKTLPNDAGSMLVAANDYQVWWGLESPKIDMMIPYHQGSVKPETTAFHGAKDYKYEQHEHFPADWKTGETRTVTLDSGEEVSLTMTEPGLRPAMIVRDVHHNSRERYLEICDKFGVTPLFARFRDHPNYMKLIRDVAREPMKQQVVDPAKIDWGEAMKIVDEWVESGAYEKETVADPALLKLVKARLEDKDFPISPVIKAGHAKTIEEILKFKPKKTEPTIKVKPPRGPGQKSVFEQLKEE